MSDVISRLNFYQQWRRGGDGRCPDPKQLGKDIDKAIAALEQLEALTSERDVLQKALLNIRRIDLSDPERYVKKADTICCEALSGHKK